jgi:hypothetical protein
VARKFDYRQIGRVHHPGPMPRVFLQRQVHVAETDAKAHEEVRQFLASPTGGAVRVGGGPIAQTRIGWGTPARGMGRDSERPDDKARGETMRMAAQSYEYNLENGLALVGSPETVIRQLEEGKKRIGYDIFCTNHVAMPKHMLRNSFGCSGRRSSQRFARWPFVCLQVPLLGAPGSARLPKPRWSVALPGQTLEH